MSSLTQMIFEGDERLFTEYTAETKKKKGIPAAATLGSNGWWWIGLKKAGKVVNGKFVPISKLKPKKSKSSAVKAKKKVAKKKVVAKKKKVGSNELTLKTDAQVSKAVASIKKLKNTLYDIAYDGDKQEIAAAKVYNDGFGIPFQKFSELTGLTSKDIDKLSSLMRDEYGSKLIGLPVKNGKVYIEGDFWRTSPKKQLKLPTGVSVGTPLPTWPESKAVQKIAKDAKIPVINPTMSAKVEAKQHRKIIESDESLHDVIDDWQSDSVWSYGKPARQRIFKTINDRIKKKNLTVKELKTLYRGMHFRSIKSGFGKTVISTFKPGKTVKLPPAGFSANINVAMSFAEFGSPELSILFVIMRKNKPIRAMHLWGGTGYGSYASEKEVVTLESKYKVLNIVLHRVGDDASSSYHCTVQLEQITTMKEDINEAENVETEQQETVIDFLFGDSMRNTAKNLKKLESKKEPSLNSEDTYMKEDGAPSPALVSPDGSIKGAPKPKDVKKMRKHLNQEK